MFLPLKRINILDSQTSNKIAAGEVVERPFSVVKELVENSIDASSKNIIVEIENGGETLIKVIDDGDGIHKEDISKAFLPHATSKIKEVEDIYNIMTLGFRGEALASIASISKTILKSKTSSEDIGVEISLTGGSIDHIVESEIGSELCSSSTNIPEYIEASSWCSLACLGDTYEAEYFTITVTTREDLE